MSEKAASAEDLRHLPDDLLFHVAKLSLSNMITLTATCSRWRRLLLREFNLKLKIRRRVFGSPHGWLLEIRGPVENDHCYTNVNLFDSLVQRRIDVPPIPSSWLFSMEKVAVSYHGVDDFIVMTIGPYGHGVVWARPGDKSWRQASSACCCFTDVAYHEAHFYGIANEGRLVAWEELESGGGLSLSFDVALPSSYETLPDRMLLTESSEGELLLVVCSVVRPMEKWEVEKVTVFKLEHQKGSSPSWLDANSFSTDDTIINEVSYRVRNSFLCM